MSETDMAVEDSVKKTSGVNTAIRAVVAGLVSIILALFIIFWEAGFIPYAASGVPHWIGPFVSLPLLAFGLSMGANCLIQQLSCSKVQWMVQLQRSAFAPLPLYGLWLFLYLFPFMKWPIEGLVQGSGKLMQTGLSSGFYVFWISMYSQGLLNGLAQMCL